MINNKNKENESRNEIPLLYDIIWSALKETDANYFECVGVLQLIVSELLNEITAFNDEHQHELEDEDD